MAKRLRGNPGKPGWWSDHPYKRHSVSEVDEFIGWNKLAEISKRGNKERHKALPIFLFLTGCRITEGLMLRLSNFDISDIDWVQCIKVPIVKQKTRDAGTRTFSFPKTEPLYQKLEEYLEVVKKRIRPRTPDPLLFPYGRISAWVILKRMGKDAGIEVWPHWFRSQRASQMGAEYEMSENDLMEWFKVKDATWARRYCKKGDFGLRNIIGSRIPEKYRE